MNIPDGYRYLLIAELENETTEIDRIRSGDVDLIDGPFILKKGESRLIFLDGAKNVDVIGRYNPVRSSDSRTTRLRRKQLTLQRFMSGWNDC